MKYEIKETLSNLFYPIAGLSRYVYTISTTSDVTTIANAQIYLLNTLVMGFCSFLFHKYKANNPDADKADWWAINLMLLSGAAYNSGNEWAWVALSIIVTLYGFFFVKQIGKKIFPKHKEYQVMVEVAISAVPCLIACYINKGLIDTLVIGGVFGLAFWFRKKDKGEDQTTHHDSWGHSVWHGLTAEMNDLIWWL